jgi:type II restriction/modification system DNA methylase subunit YeeA
MNKMLFCLFAEHIDILPSGLFTRLLEAASRDPRQFQPMARDLFSAMKSGGRFGVEIIDWFNGGLFDDDDTLDLDKPDIDEVLKMSQLDWGAVEPSIFGTLFERGLDPNKRSQLGAHFTDQQSIMRIVEPVVLAPLRAEWAITKTGIAGIMAEYRKVVDKGGPPKTEVRVKFGQSKKELAGLSERRDRGAVTAAANRLLTKAKELCRAFLHRLESFRVLDPACGSGNFLYLSLLGLKDLEQAVIAEAEGIGLERFFPAVGPQSVMGIELNLYSAELARVTIWIGQIQWMLRHGWGLSKDPILKPLDQISCRDALLNLDGTEAEWPTADCIVGNPPFLGDKKMLSELGEDCATVLRERYKGRVPGGADLVTYWFAKAWDAIKAGKTQRAGLVATNSIRGGQNRTVLDKIVSEGRIFEAWSDDPWVLDGAAVRVSIVCFDREHNRGPATLDGRAVGEIYADLVGTAAGAVMADLTKAKNILESNNGVSFQGIKQVGRFTIPGSKAREWLLLPANPTGKRNADVLKPWVNGRDVTRRPSDTWIIDMGVNLSLEEAVQYEKPFEYIERAVKPTSAMNRDRWWLFERTRPEMRAALAGLNRYIVTPRVAKYRLFVWFQRPVLPDTAVVVVCRDDDTTFGILHSRFHEAWSLRKGTWLGVGNDPRYTPTTTFETFPFPEGLTPNIPAGDYASDARAVAIADAASRLNQLRENWLNPPELVRREPEVVPGFPDRLIPIDAKAAKELKKRTLTNLYNQRPAWLAQAHERLDSAVAVAYGWPSDINEEEALKKLLELNLSRSA